MAGELHPERAHGAEPRGVVRGRITIVQEDRIRLMDAVGRGYLFTVGKRVAPTPALERWRDTGLRVDVEYHGQPDAGAVASRVTPAVELEPGRETE